MLLTNYEPWSLFHQTPNLFDWRGPRRAAADVTRAAAADWAPPVDIREEAEHFVIRTDVPGIDPARIEITLENGVLTISGERTFEDEENTEHYRRRERIFGSFVRRFTLPDTVDTDAISASANNGVLEITVPKQEKVQTRRIAVDA